jgi:hypothetical protein
VASAARNAVAPPRAQRVIEPAPRQSDVGAEWFALSFARAYLTWSSDPSTRAAALRPFLDGADDPDVGLAPAAGSAEQVSWLAVAGERDGPDGMHDYTVAAGTGGGAVRYLSVAVAKAPGGAEFLARYPALVTAPTPGRAGELDGGATVVPVEAGLTLRSLLRLAVEPSGAVIATLLAADARGDLFTLAYEFTVRQIGGRWEITRIQS